MKRLVLYAGIPIIIILLLAGASHAGQGKGDDSRHLEYWKAPESAERRSNPVPVDAASLAEGKKLYQTYCANCHGETGRGDGPAGAALNPRPADLTRHAAHHRDGNLAWKIATGRPPMPAWKGRLTETQIWQVVNYIKHGFGPTGENHQGHKGQR